MRVLLVEDDLPLGESLKEGLEIGGYTVDWTKDGIEAQNAAINEGYDAIVLDLGLPKRSGLEVLKNLRSRNINTPIVILTAKGGTDDLVVALDAGADDYLVKPADLDELCARIRAHRRRSTGRTQTSLSYKDITLDPASHAVYQNGQVIEVSRHEFALLNKFLENIGRVLSRKQLAETLYGWGDDIESNALEVHIHHLRKKFGAKLIRTIRGVGYMIELEQPVEEDE